MKFAQESSSRINTINAYHDGVVTVTVPEPRAGTPGGRIELVRSFIITPDHLDPDWPPQTLTELEEHHFSQLVKFKPEVVIFGSGEQFGIPEPALSAALYQNGIGFEAMDSAAACRTYNLLGGDGRRIVAAILLPGPGAP